MKILRKLKYKIINSNVYVFDLMARIKYYKTNKLTCYVLKQLERIDPILNYEEFRNAIEPLLQTNQYLSYSGIGSESRHYGHLDMLYEYAGCKNRNGRLLFPAIEHAASRGVVKIRADEEVIRNLSFVYQSRYRKDNIHERNGYKPVFCIGSYIHYAKPYYSKDVMRDMKLRYGKTLTIFAGHNREDQEMEYSDQEFVDYVMAYANDNHYDTVLVSVYFCDTDKELYHEFDKRGAILVSCGFREDRKFIQRLRAIFELSDMVLSNNIGSPEGFTKYLGLPYMVINKTFEEISDIELVKQPIDMQHHMISFDKLKYLMTIKERNAIQQQVYDELYVYYSGENYLTRTPEQIRAMIHVMERILRYSKGFYSKYDGAVIRVMRELERDKNTIEYQMLRESLGEVDGE